MFSNFQAFLIKFEDKLIDSEFFNNIRYVKSYISYQ